MKEKGFPIYISDDDDDKGPFVHKYFECKDVYEMEAIIYKDKVIGAANEDFTSADYALIKVHLTESGYYKTVDDKQIVKSSPDRTDIWLSRDGEWKVRIDYHADNKEKPKKITLVIAKMLKLGFEK